MEDYTLLCHVVVIAGGLFGQPDIEYVNKIYGEIIMKDVDTAIKWYQEKRPLYESY